MPEYLFHGILDFPLRRDFELALHMPGGDFPSSAWNMSNFWDLRRDFRVKPEYSFHGIFDFSLRRDFELALHMPSGVFSSSAWNMSNFGICAEIFRVKPEYSFCEVHGFFRCCVISNQRFARAGKYAGRRFSVKRRNISNSGICEEILREREGCRKRTESGSRERNARGGNREIFPGAERFFDRLSGADRVTIRSFPGRTTRFLPCIPWPGFCRRIRP